MSGKRLGEYEILDQLGEGGMGAVFRARHERLGRMVALKVLRPGSVSNPEHERRFQREMTIAAGLSHPALVKILDGGTIDGTGFIAMELVEGFTITNIVNRWAPLPWPVALSIASRIADGLAYLHDRTILHRDIKPSNILVSSEGWVKLFDFGLARWAGSTVMTQEGAVVGTLQFLSPELLTGEDASAMSDLWAAGCVMYLMLAGRMHVMAAEFNDWVQAIVNDPIPPPGQFEPSIPAPVSQLCARLLAHDPAQRPPDANALRDEIDGLLESLAGTTWDRVLGPETLRQLDDGSFALPSPPSAMQTQDLPAAPAHPTPLQRLSRAISAPGTEAAVSARTPTSPRSHAARPVSRPASRPLTRPDAPHASTRGAGSLARVAIPLCGLLVGAGLAIAYFVRPALAPPRASSAAASPSVAAPASAAPLRAPGRRPLSSYGKDFVAYLPRLRAGGQTAKRAVEDIRSASPLDFGHSAANWIYWIELDAWLSNPQRPPAPPRYRFAVEGQLNVVDESISLSWLSRHANALSESLVTTAIRSAGGAPDDARTWLTLGRMLELEGRSAESLVAYRQALDRLGTRAWGDFPIYLWTALARALLRAPGRDIDREWWTYLPADRECRKAWIGLSDALRNESPDRLEAILKGGLTRGPHADMARVVLGTVLSEVGGDPERARRIWVAALKERPRSEAIVAALLFHYGARGRVVEARELARKHALLPYLPLLAYQSGDMNVDLGWTGKVDPTVRVRLLELDTFRQLELGRIADAETLAESLNSDERAQTRELAPLYLELLGCGATRPWIEKTVRKLLEFDPPDVRLWDDAAGSLASGPGAPIMQRALVRPDGIPYPQATWREAITAVWYSRRGKHAQALDHLARADEVSRGEGLPVYEAAEVLTRPELDARLGKPVDRAVLERAKTLRGPAAGNTLAGFVDDVRAGRHGAARDRVRALYEVHPEHVYLALAWAWLARLGGAAAEEREARERLAAGARWHLTGLWAIRAVNEKK